MKRINEIINVFFDENYFLDAGSKDAELAITGQIEHFLLEHPNVVSNYLEKVNRLFPDAKIENWTQFFNSDRCVRLLIQFDNDKRYVCQLSIFGYYSVYHCPYKFVHGKYIYGAKLYIDPNELEISDELYKCATSLLENLEWLNREILNQTVYDFSIPEINHLREIKIADLLFTDHYL